MRRLFSVFIFISLSSIILTGCTLPFQKNDTAGLQVTTDKSEGSVFLNGELANKTPFLDKELKPGTYTIRVEPVNSDYVPYETSITLYPNTLAVFNWTFDQTPEKSGGVIYEMEPISDKEKTLLSIVSIPDSTIVKIDGKSEGFTPVLINNVTPGSHQYEISLPSYLTKTESVELNAGYQMNVTVKLAKDPAALQLQIKNDADATSSAVASDSAKIDDIKDTKEKPITTSKPSASPTKVATTSQIDPPYVEILETGTGWLRVRAEASGSSEELAKVDVGEKYSYFQTEDGWLQIEYETGKKGWISGQYGKLVK